MRRHITIGLALVLLFGCTNEQEADQQSVVPAPGGQADTPRAASEAPTVEDTARSYEQLHLVTKEPVFVSLFLALSCVGTTQRDIDAERERTGVHAHTTIRIFMNDSALAAFRASAATYPVGAVIVKEKRGLHYFGDDQQGQASARTPDGVGGMIKRARGYDPKHGDWEYFYFEDPAAIERGRISSCVDCHRGAAETDFVFGHWAARASIDADAQRATPVLPAGGAGYQDAFGNQRE